ncbi:LytR C-terminal domain-containing protein [Fodinicola feengrottensis]|uniref:LytR C-terminal domain-containing protein n=1 Tax=Fodinicola feengrottensis TaxID=435914 RepID=UPI0013CF6F16|nr:LytR C-terminal domain-containing protein [Fodinicola feengrottensis]
MQIFNATDRDGLANTVKSQLAGRGFKVVSISTFQDGTPVTGVGLVRYGPTGIAAAQVVQSNIIGLTPVMDTRATADVDIVLGAQYSRLATTSEINTAAKRLAADPVTPMCSGTNSG